MATRKRAVQSAVPTNPADTLLDWLGVSAPLGGQEDTLQRGDDIALPADPTPLDSTRMSDVSTQRMGQNPSDGMPHAAGLLDNTRLAGSLPISTTIGQRGRPGLSTPGEEPTQSASDAVAQFLHGQDGSLTRGGEAAQVQRARETQLDDMTRSLGLEAQFPHTTFSGASPTDVNRLRSDIASDPFTGDAAQAREKYDEDARNAANLAETQPFKGQRQHAEAVALQTAIAGHP